MGPRQARWRRWAAFLLVQAAVTLALCELAVRLLTKTSPDNGMPMIGKYPLLPFRPEPEAVRAWLKQAANGRYVVPDPQLGWSLKAGGGSPDGVYHANPEGARAADDHRYGERPTPGRLRMVTVGDSFTHGDGVGIEDTWQRELERRRPDLEVINLGVPAYGTDQAFLRWQRDGVRFRPNIAVLGIWPENLCRNLSVVRYFLQAGSGFLSKPRFLLADRRLETLNAPVLEGEPLVKAVTDPAGTPLLRHDYWAIPGDLEPRPWHHLRVARVAATVANLYRRRAMRARLYSGADASAIDVTVAIAEAFRQDAERAGVVPVVLLIPMLDLLEPYPDEGSLPLARALRARGLDVIDLGPPMAQAVKKGGSSCCYQADRHLSSQGNRLLAAWFLERVGSRLEGARGAD